MIRRSLSVVVPLLFAAGIVMAVEWSDVEGRIQYAWYTEDTRALRGVLASLEGGVSDDPLQAYYLGFGQYRLALLGLGRAREAAAKAAENCVDHLAAANEARRDFADALALQAACQGLVASLKAWKAPLLAPRSASQLERALAGEAFHGDDHGRLAGWSCSPLRSGSRVGCLASQCPEGAAERRDFRRLLVPRRHEPRFTGPARTPVVEFKAL